MSAEQPTLQRSLGLAEATSFVVGGIVGAGIFRTPNLVAAEMGSAGPTMVLWLLGGVIAPPSRAPAARAAPGKIYFLKNPLGNPCTKKLMHMGFSFHSTFESQLHPTCLT